VAFDRLHPVREAARLQYHGASAMPPLRHHETDRDHGSAPPAAAPPVPPELEHPACPLCGLDEVAVAGVAEPPYRAVRCRCGFWYLKPRLAEEAMAETYRDDRYFEGEGLGYSSYLAQEPTLRRTFRHLLRSLERRGMTGGSVLEVGCAYGFFLEEAQGLFSRREGTDFSRAAAAEAARRIDRIRLGGLEQLGADERFDLVACIHVIEHVYDPVAFVERLRSHLHPGGWLILATPDMGGFWRSLLGHRWPFYKMPEHVTYFDRRSLARLLGLAGYVDVRPLPYASYFSLDLVGEKLGVRLPGPLGRLQVRLPATTVAMAGQAP